MENGQLHSLVPLADFKAILGIDDREDALACYCLLTSTYTAEQHCKRRLLRRKTTEYLTFTGDNIFNLREYPVRKVLTVHAISTGAALRGELFEEESLIDPKYYYCLPDEGIHEDLPFSLALRPPLRMSGKKYPSGCGIWRGTHRAKPRRILHRPV
jgi:hypothetical protein